MATQVCLFDAAVHDHHQTPFTVKQLQATQQIKRLRGGSQSQLMRASDQCYWAVKFLGNPQADRVLANEFFASRLGQCLCLPVPEVEFIEVSDWLITHSPELRVEMAGISRPFRSGLHLGSKFAANPEIDLIFDYLPEEFMERVSNRDNFARMLVLDKWTSNVDGRQAVFTKRRNTRKFAVTFIDQGYSFNANEWNFPDLALHGVYYRNYVYENVRSWECFEPALTLAESMDHQQIWECAEPIPSEWCAPDPSALPRLVDELYRRRSKIRDLITAFRESARSPFPYWKS